VSPASREPAAPAVAANDAVNPSPAPYALPPEDEFSLLPRLSAGEEAAIRDVYLRHHDTVRSFAQRLIGDREAAEDLVHEVFVALPRAARRFRGEASLRHFLFSIAVNHARQHLRTAVRRRRAQQRLMLEPGSTPVTPGETAENRQLARALVAALDELPIDQRVAFVLCEVEERSSGEAARIAGTSDANIRARLFKARRTLRRLLAAWHAKGESR
jgi:RNA polymerase sigma-70 factor (ECF subfamily)